MTKARTSNNEEAAEPKVPTDLRNNLADLPGVMALWKGLTPIARRDFVSWIEGAKQQETRKRRIETLGSMLAAGKRRPCCYAVVPMNLYKALGDLPKAKAEWKGLTSDERRDFTDWINRAKGAQASAERIEKTCVMLLRGKRHP